MKVYKKEVRKITVNEVLFLYVVDEQAYDIIIRIYSNAFKSTFVEFVVLWRETWDILFYEPKLISKLVQYAINQGWDFHQKSNQMKFDNATSIIRVLMSE
ncbi:hypothetical protein [Paenibacillus illinoisensis]|uniref:Uncharacterized protein n=1 Tax=Paenibacillus illinoisensis TaxID=59845 RepID=A0A2W0CQN3_9BACL|nr:hypothetical protein [Paenibacillus illinoisensis]PYY29948.1 Uncharacterized protein PIL02S_01545 [Paenibacillus illinoisensis]